MIDFVGHGVGHEGKDGKFYILVCDSIRGFPIT